MKNWRTTITGIIIVVLYLAFHLIQHVALTAAEMIPVAGLLGVAWNAKDAKNTD